MYIPKNKAKSVIDSISAKTGEAPDIVMNKLIEKGHTFEGLNEAPLNQKQEALSNQLKNGGAVAGVKAGSELNQAPAEVQNVIRDGVNKFQFDFMGPKDQAEFKRLGGQVKEETQDFKREKAFKDTFKQSIKEDVISSAKDRVTGAVEGFQQSFQAGVDVVEKDFAQSAEALAAGDKGQASIEFGSAIAGGVAGGIKTFFSTIGGLIKPELETLVEGVDKGYTESIKAIAESQGMTEEEAVAQAERSKEFQIETFVSKPMEQISASIDTKADQVGQTMGWSQTQIDSAKDAFKNVAEAELNNILLKSASAETQRIGGAFGDTAKVTTDLAKTTFDAAGNIIKPKATALANLTKEVAPSLYKAGQNGLAKGELAIAGAMKSVKANRAAKEIAKVETASQEAYNASLKITKPKAKEIMSAGDETRAIKALNDFIPEISEGVTGTPQQQATKAFDNIKSITAKNNQLTDALVERPTAQQIPVYKPLRILSDMLQEEKGSVRPNSERLKMLEKAIEEEAAFIEGKPLELSPKNAREIKRKIDSSINFDGKPFFQLTDTEKLTQQRFKVQRDAYRQALDEALPETIEGRTYAEIDLDTAGLLDLSKVMKEEARRLGIKGDRNWAENALTFFEGKLGGLSGKAAITLLGGAAGNALGAGAFIGAGLSIGAIQFLENRAALIASLKGKLKTILDASPEAKAKVKAETKKAKADAQKDKPQKKAKPRGSFGLDLRPKLDMKKYTLETPSTKQYNKYLKEAGDLVFKTLDDMKLVRYKPTGDIVGIQNRAGDHILFSSEATPKSAGVETLNIKDLVLDKGLLEKINRKSRTPDEPIIVGTRLDENNNKIIRVLDGHHRIKEALDRGETKIDAIFETIPNDKEIVLYHSSPDKFESGKPEFDAYFGTEEFAKTFEKEFGENEYRIVLPKDSNLLDIDGGSADAKTLVEKFGGKLDDMDDFYIEDWVDKKKILPTIKELGYDGAVFLRHEEYILTKELIEKAETTTPKSTVPFKNESSYTINVLNELEGKTSVSKQFIKDAAKRKDVRANENEIILDTLKEMPEGKKINVKVFAEKLDSKFLKLERSEEGDLLVPGEFDDGTINDQDLSHRYERIVLPKKLRGDVFDYGEHIYSSPLETSVGGIHFSEEDWPNYFAHTRVEEMEGGEIKRVIELQSDLLQRDRLEKEASFSTALSEEVLKKQNKGSSLKVDETVSYDGEEFIITENKNGFVSGKNVKDVEIVKKLEAYRNTFHEPIIRQEIQEAAKSDFKKVQFPTGRTAMEIEGLSGGAEGTGPATWEYDLGDGWEPINPARVRKGMVLADRSDIEWVVTEITDIGKFRALKRKSIDEWIDENSFDFNKDNDGYKAMLDDSPDEFTNMAEEFTLSDSIDKSNPIYKFYEKDIKKFLEKNYDAKQVTDEQGVEWTEVEIKPEHKTEKLRPFASAGKVNKNIS